MAKKKKKAPALSDRRQAKLDTMNARRGGNVTTSASESESDSDSDSDLDLESESKSEASDVQSSR